MPNCRIWPNCGSAGRPWTRPCRPTSPLQVEVLSLEPFALVATRNTGDFADLAVAYEALFGWAAEHGLIEHIAGIYGVPQQDPRDTPPAECEFDCALAFSAEATAGDGTVPLTLGGGQWARLRHVGPYAGLEPATDALLAEWLPHSGYALRASRCSTITSTIRNRPRKRCCARMSIYR